MKLTPLQRHRLHEAKRDASAVLSEIKSAGNIKPGQHLADMKTLEETVINLECLLVGK